MGRVERVGLCGTSLCRTPTDGLGPSVGAALRASKFAPGKFVEPSGFKSAILSTKHKKRPLTGPFFMLGGEGGIRTHGTPKRTTDFESAPFDHSGTSPHGRRMLAFLAAKFHVLFNIRLFSSPRYIRMTSFASIWDNRRDCPRIVI